MIDEREEFMKNGCGELENELFIELQIDLFELMEVNYEHLL